MLKIEFYVERMIKLKITPNQFLFCYLIFLGNTEILFQYMDKGRGWSHQEIDELVTMGLLEDFNHDEKFSTGFNVTEKFTKGFLQNAFTLGQALWDAYPSFGKIEGRSYPIKAVMPDKLYELYQQITGGQIAVHNRIMAALEKGKKMNLVTMRIDRWLESRQWEMIEADETYKDKPSDREFTSD